MQLNNTELAQLADHLVYNIDCNPDFEDDAFAITFRGVRCYIERYRDNFRVEVGHEDDVVQLPRI
ncbi:hypothetical protein [Novosphingobium guangzhouense]|uniref:Uncharacterized protein n=1 Tax=Novosphingobium guangzhouense TaxID=1850347 RepID=A0A2K2G0K2_9SPHN|nr:hypothetical protein [Novosphingobium guangzhouense]PNU04589.1 hypothetical protein A8V01_19465 [Novosphingobium guangzhouense]